MLIGSAWLSTSREDSATDPAALKAVGSERIYREKVSRALGSTQAAPASRSALRRRRVVMWKVDRRSRSLRDMVTVMERLNEARVTFAARARRSTLPAPLGV